MKRVNTVLAGKARATRTITGKTRFIQGTCQAVCSANIRCMSMHRWTAVSFNGPRGSGNDFAAGMTAASRLTQDAFDRACDPR